MPGQHTEQAFEASIAAFLDLGKGRVDVLIEKVKNSILMFQEYRAAIISAAVTGKIDVRNNRVAEKIAT